MGMSVIFKKNNKLLPCPTRIRRLKDETVYYEIELLNLRGVGKLREVSIVTDSPNFRLVFVVDGHKFCDETWSELSQISAYSEYLDVFEDDGKYVLRISDIGYEKTLMLRLSPETRLQVIQFIAVYDDCS